MIYVICMVYVMYMIHVYMYVYTSRQIQCWPLCLDGKVSWNSEAPAPLNSEYVFMYSEGRDRWKEETGRHEGREGIRRKEILETHYCLSLSSAKFKLRQWWEAGTLQNSAMQKENSKEGPTSQSPHSQFLCLYCPIWDSEGAKALSAQRTKNKGKCHTLGVLILRKCSFVNYLWVHDDHRTKPD